MSASAVIRTRKPDRIWEGTPEIAGKVDQSVSPPAGLTPGDRGVGDTTGISK